MKKALLNAQLERLYRDCFKPPYILLKKELNKDIYYDAVVEVLIRIIPFIDGKLEIEFRKLSKEELKEYIVDLEVEINSYFYVVLKRDLIKIQKERDKLIFKSELEISIDKSSKGSVKKFANYFQKNKSQLASAIDEPELQFILYVISDHLTKNEKIVIDAVYDDNKQSTKEAKSILGQDVFYQTKRRLLRKGKFHKIAIEVAKQLVSNGGYKDFGLNPIDMFSIIRNLKEQLKELKQQYEKDKEKRGEKARPPAPESGG